MITFCRVSRVDVAHRKDKLLDLGLIAGLWSAVQAPSLLPFLHSLHPSPPTSRPILAHVLPSYCDNKAPSHLPFLPTFPPSPPSIPLLVVAQA